ncbi:unnamed protein product [Macrosiphum euphorbiae]|uniref:Uncharacterized protein n=1 Tax=Macrosiphum euphorbiae TaxID=13131 RepID=A0AAV0WPN4_9HEMI|nr:unnamed protein product [Macrosiphum euphorbiae]
MHAAGLAPQLHPKHRSHNLPTDICNHRGGSRHSTNNQNSQLLNSPRSYSNDAQTPGRTSASRTKVIDPLQNEYSIATKSPILYSTTIRSDDNWDYSESKNSRSEIELPHVFHQTL